MTANPKWPEIVDACTYYVSADPADPSVNFTAKPGYIKMVQPATDRPDIVARVFDLKKDALLRMIVQGTFRLWTQPIYPRCFREVLWPRRCTSSCHRISKARYFVYQLHFRMSGFRFATYAPSRDAR